LRFTFRLPVSVGEIGSAGARLPIAKLAAKLAVGYLLDELKNDITRETPASSSRPLITSSPKFRVSPSRNSRRPTRR